MSIFLKPIRQRKLFLCWEPIQSYKCFSCNYTTYEKAEKIRHICGINAPKSKVKLKRCSRCAAVCFSVLWRYFHRGKCSVSINDKTTESCSIVDKNRTFQQNSSKYLIHCDHCDFTANKPATLKKHRKTSHGLLETGKCYWCDQCAYKVKIKYSLVNHVKTQHLLMELQKKYKCDECEYKTAYKFHLKKHKKYHMPFELQHWYQCDRCTYKSLNEGSLNEHKNRKHIPLELRKHYDCDECEYKTLYKKKLKYHKGNHMRYSYQCSECNWKFWDKYNFERHKNSEHKKHKSDLRVELLKFYECDQCKFKTRFHGYLKIHKSLKHILLK